MKNLMISILISAIIVGSLYYFFIHECEESGGVFNFSTLSCNNRTLNEPTHIPILTNTPTLTTNPFVGNTPTVTTHPVTSITPGNSIPSMLFPDDS